MNKKILTLVFVVVLQACASAPNGPEFSLGEGVSDSKGVIYVYRPPKNYASAVTFALFMNETKIADIAQKGYVKVEVDPGSYIFETKTSAIDEPITVDVGSGESKYLRLSIKVHDPLGFSASYYFEPKSFSDAEHEISNTRREVDRYYGP